MDIIEILRYCNENSIKLFVEEGRLRLKSPATVINERLIASIKEQKSALIALLIEQPSKNAVVNVADKQHLPLSYAQQRLFLLHKMDPQSGAYNMPNQIEVNGELNWSYFERAICLLVERHEVLRTTFQTEEGQVYACFQHDRLPRITFVDLGGYAGLTRQEKIDQLTREETLLPFDLQKDLPIRITVLQLASEHAILLFTLPHIVSDGWSMGVLVRDFCRLYRDLDVGEAQPLPPLQYQYADFAHWQKNRLSSEHLKTSLDYWRCTLGDLPLCHNLPVMFNGREKKMLLGEKLTLRMESWLRDQITVFCQQHNVTLFIFLQTVFALLVSRYANDRDAIVGFPISGREDERFFNNIGCFVNTLIARTRIDPDESFLALLRRSKGNIIEAYEHQAVPFDMLVEELNPPRAWQCNPLFQILFTLHNNDEVVTSLPNIELRRRENQSIPLKMDLEVSATEADGGIHIDWLYNPNLFERYVMLGMLECYPVLIQNILAAPEQSVERLSLLSAQAETEILRVGQGSSTESGGLSLPQLFEAQCQRTPDAIAVIFDNQNISYRQLNASANRLAQRLKAQVEITPDMAIGVYCTRSAEMLVSLLAILKAGVAYLPLDPSYPAQRIAYMLTHSEVELVLTTPQLISALPSGAFRPLPILDGSLLVDASAADDYLNRPAFQPENLAYIIYTSGSSGDPKGVMITHRSVVNFLQSMQVSPGFSAQDRLLAVTPISFDISVLELFLPICCGGQVVICPEQESRHALHLSDLLVRHRISVMQATPATWKLLLQSPRWKEHAGLKVLCGGEAISRELASELCENMGSFWNMYGPTETTVWSTTGQIQSADAPINIGQPISNTTVYVLNQHQQLAPAGVSGELYIGGDGLSRGYYKRTDLTEERFVANPFVSRKDAIIYRTGDIARWNAQGEITLLGRSDDQVKIRGYRVELGEIESALRSHEWVSDTAVRISAHHDGMLVACVVLTPAAREQTSVMPEELNRELSGHLSRPLPDYMVPQQFLYIDALPLTPNGKVDRKALPDVTAQLVSGAQYVAGRNNRERQLCAIWQQVLESGQVGIHDNFFSLGGNSLTLFRLFNETQKGGFNYSLEDLFKYQSIYELESITYPTLDVQNIGVPVSSVIVKLNHSTAQHKVFCVHPEGGIATCYAALASLLADEAEFYGLQAPPIFGDAISATIDNLAGYYTEAILRQQPTGGYRILGWSLGGSIAWQLAVRLRERGYQVEYLGVFDSELPVLASPDEREQLAWEALVTDFKADGLFLDNNALLSLTLSERKICLREKIEVSGIRPEGISREMTHRYLDYLIDVKRSKYATRLAHSDLDIDYYAIENSIYSTHDPCRGWETISSGNVTLLSAGGSHLTMLQPPFVASLADTLRRRMGGREDE
ncbi:non-ribosomal peptide synthetase [Xenorhabdus bovienii]|uniref:Amino acid adenylation domain protein n=1 Tax=Xenorhabdus bovienii str. kraussei Becker Underwood TaxID=1398204 RepID=A0A077Q183_XENBV|nr:non-ribosomal peptide synthetase [Xenorhabdus bovienii]CDH26807.1 Amino acid adenylation domain protein [Xenorhabdus bovienii str. kraussei Becker Underwood]